MRAGHERPAPVGSVHVTAERRTARFAESQRSTRLRPRAPTRPSRAPAAALGPVLGSAFGSRVGDCERAQGGGLLRGEAQGRPQLWLPAHQPPVAPRPGAAAGGSGEMSLCLPPAATRPPPPRPPRSRCQQSFSVIWFLRRLLPPRPATHPPPLPPAPALSHPQPELNGFWNRHPLPTSGTPTSQWLSQTMAGAPMFSSPTPLPKLPHGAEMRAAVGSVQGWIPTVLREGPGSGSPRGGPPIVQEAWGQLPRSGQPRPHGRTPARPGRHWVSRSAPHPCTRISHTHLYTYLTHPCTLPCTHSAPLAPAPQGERWKWLTGGSNGQLLRDAVAGRGCGGRMRFQTLRSRGGAGEGPSRDRGCRCLGDAGGGTGAFASAATAARPPRPRTAAVRGGGAWPTTHTSHTHTTSRQGSAHPGQLSLGGSSVWRYPGCPHPQSPDLGQALRPSFWLALVWPSHRRGRPPPHVSAPEAPGPSAFPGQACPWAPLCPSPCAPLEKAPGRHLSRDGVRRSAWPGSGSPSPAPSWWKTACCQRRPFCC